MKGFTSETENNFELEKDQENKGEIIQRRCCLSRVQKKRVKEFKSEIASASKTGQRKCERTMKSENKNLIVKLQDGKRKC